MSKHEKYKSDSFPQNVDLSIFLLKEKFLHWVNFLLFLHKVDSTRTMCKMVLGCMASSTTQLERCIHLEATRTHWNNKRNENT